MITPAEHSKINSIKHRAINSIVVSSQEKQWLLTLMARESKPVDSRVIALAESQGFRVTGLVTA